MSKLHPASTSSEEYDLSYESHCIRVAAALSSHQTCTSMDDVCRDNRIVSTVPNGT